MTQNVDALTKYYFLMNVTKENRKEIEIFAREWYYRMKKKKKMYEGLGTRQEKLRMGIKDR